MILWGGQTVTREGRARNIFGLSTCSYSRKYGQTGEDNSKGDHLAVFPIFENGYHAAIDMIRDRYLVLGMFLPSIFGNRWSGDRAKVYGYNLAKVMRVNPLTPLTFKGAGDGLLRALAIMENGDPCRDIPQGFFGQFINEDI